MGKAMIILVLLVVGFFAVMLFMGSRVVAPADGDGGGFNTPEAPDIAGAAKKGAVMIKETAGKAASGAKEAAHKAGVMLDTSVKGLKSDRDVVEVKPGFKSDFKVTRLLKPDLKAADIRPFKLDIIPAPGSKLIVSGGEFKQGETETTVSVDAPIGAGDASLTIRSGENVKPLIVAIKIIK